MSAKMIAIGAVAVIAVIVLIFLAMLVGSYNSFVGMDQEVNSKWSEVENQYQRQADLIPNLVSVLASAANTETNFVTEVTQARTKWLDAKSVADKDVAGVEMTNSVTTLVNAIATTEGYPTLQANKQFTAVMDELSGTQNRITTARGRYISAIQSYNTAIKQMPGNFFASMFGFIAKDYYTADVKAMTTPSLGTGQLP